MNAIFYTCPGCGLPVEIGVPHICGTNTTVAFPPCSRCGCDPSFHPNTVCASYVPPPPVMWSDVCPMCGRPR